MSEVSKCQQRENRLKIYFEIYLAEIRNRFLAVCAIISEGKLAPGFVSSLLHRKTFMYCNLEGGITQRIITKPNPPCIPKKNK